MSHNSENAAVVIVKDGPYLVSGSIPLSTTAIGTDNDGGSEKWIEGKDLSAPSTYALCRCGHSGNKPFCDGTHTKIHFVGTETASRLPFLDEAKVYDGPGTQLYDNERLCASARFCDPNGKVWNQVEKTDQPAVRAVFARQVGNCPSGRLVARDTTSGEILDPQQPVSIGLIEDPAEKCAGPLWLRGGIPVIGADGFRYEVRNRATLCRCGQSKNKPFCDGTHLAVQFQGE